MSEQLINEKLIADELNSLPVPGIENIIWGRIGNMLDANPVITERHHQHSHKKYTGFHGQFMVILFAALIAIICLVVVNKKYNNTKKNLPATPEQKLQAKPDSFVKNIPSDNNADNSIKSKTIQVEKKGIRATHHANKIYLYPDSQQISQRIKDSSNNLFPAPAIIRMNDANSVLKDSASNFKKVNGVKRITDSGYRMVPGKGD